MKNTGVILVGVASGLVAAVATYAVLSNMQVTASTENDEEFLDRVRDEAATSKDSEYEVASLGPANASGDMVPAIEVETHEYDMGVIANDKVSEGQVMVYNRGKGPLRISKVNTQCGCTKGKMSKEVIPPGESAPLDITVDPFRIPQFTSTKTLTLFTNDPDDPTVKIDVSARVDPEIVVTPNRVDFGTLEKGKTAEQDIRVVQNTEQPLTLKGVRLIGQSQYYELDYKERDPSEWANPDRREYLITAKVLPDAPTGKLRANIIMETEIPRLPRFTVPMELEIKGLYSIEPRVITLRDVKAGETVKDVLKAEAEVPFEIVDIKTSNDYMTVQQRPGEQPNTVAFDLVMAEDPNQRWQRDTWTLTVRADDQEFHEEVRVMAIIKDMQPTATADTVQDNPVVQERVERLRQQARENAQAVQQEAEEAAPGSPPQQ